MLRLFSLEAPYFAWAGIGFGDSLSRVITQSLRRLADNIKPKSLRFWGRIFAREQDYYIAQSITNPFVADPLAEGVEKIG